MKDETQELPIAPIRAEALPMQREPVSALDILEAIAKGGITEQNVNVVEKIIQLRRDEVKEQAKRDFARAFFNLKKEIAAMDIYADKAARNDAGSVIYVYCSEEELSKLLEPVLMRHGFAMLFGQKPEEGFITSEVTLLHEGGHQEIRSYSVRPGATNRMKDNTAVDAGAATTAWRHLMIKMFGLKSRIMAGNDPRNEGERISEDDAKNLQIRIQNCGGDEVRFLALAGIKGIAGKPTLKDYMGIMSEKLPMLLEAIKKKERQ